MHFAIIAAGEGSRMLEEGVPTPKPLVELNGKPLIARLLDSVAGFKPNSLTVIINENFMQVLDFIESYPFYSDIGVIAKTTPSSLHSLYELRPFLEGKPFFLFTVDTVFRRRELAEFVSDCGKLPAGYDSVAITDYIDDEKPLYVRLDADGEYVAAFENDRSDNKYVTGGIYYFSSPVFPIIEKIIGEGKRNLRLFLRELVAGGSPVRAYKFGKMIDVDRVCDIAVAEKFLAEEI